MEFSLRGEDLTLLLRYPESVCIRLNGKYLRAQSRLRGLDTLTAFTVTADDALDEFFAVTLSGPVLYFKGATGKIKVTLEENTISFSDSMVIVTLPITRDIVADFDIPDFDAEDARPVPKKTRYGLRSMMATMTEIAKELVDYSGNRVTIKDKKATYINHSMLLECLADLPDMCVSTTSLNNMLTLTNNAEELAVYDAGEYVIFFTSDIVIRIMKDDNVNTLTADALMGRGQGEIETTTVKCLGQAKRFAGLSSFRDSNTASLTYNENAIGVSMRGNGYNITSSVNGRTIIINPRVLIVLGKFLASDEYTIERGLKHICLSIPDRKLVICATSY